MTDSYYVLVLLNGGHLMAVEWIAVAKHRSLNAITVVDGGNFAGRSGTVQL